MAADPIEIPIPEFLRARDEGAVFELVDCREKWEWEIVHLPGARLMPLHELVRSADQLPTDRPVIVYCHHGVRSLRAAYVLRAAGISARSLSGGIDRLSVEADPALPRY